MNKKIALGVSSSIGIYKACEVVRGFQKHGVDVRVVMTPNAARLVSPLLFSSLAGTRTIVDLFEEPDTRTIRDTTEVRAKMLNITPEQAMARLAEGTMLKVLPESASQSLVSCAIFSPESRASAWRSIS